jgi:hypothetical protein
MSSSPLGKKIINYFQKALNGNYEQSSLCGKFKLTYQKRLKKKILNNFKFVHVLVFRNIPHIITLLFSLVIGYNWNDSLVV